MSCPFCLNDQGPVVSARADYVLCPSCKLVYLRTRPSAEQSIARYQTYADGNSHMRLPETIADLKASGLRRQSFFKELTQFCPPPFDLLDIGSGWGAFLLEAREAGCRVSGVEVCRKMADFANNVLGIRTHTQPIEQLLAEVDVVTMIHVFEHMPDAKSALSAIHRFLRPGGIFAGIVPNYHSFASKTLGDNWAWLDAHYHYYQWTPDTLAARLQTSGFALLRLYTAIGDYDETALRKLLETFRPETTIEELLQNGQGEEIRFFCRKVV